MAKQKHGKKKKKFNLVFDEQNRKDYLKGFKKRKDERRMIAKEKLEQEFKEEKKKIKLKQKEMYQKLLGTQRQVPEVEHLVEPVKYELPSHTVTITSAEDVDLAGHNDLHVGANLETDNKNVDKVLKNCKNVEDVKKAMKKKHNQQLKSSKKLKPSIRIQSKKDRQKFKRLKRQNKGQLKKKKKK